MGKVIVTGAEGFIGSNLVRYLNENGIDDILIVDSAGNGYLKDARYSSKMSIGEFTLWCITATRENLKPDPAAFDAVFHLGALVDTMSSDPKIFDYNYTFSKVLADFCSVKKIPLLYASSAAVYGFAPTFRENCTDLQPLNMYAKSKYLFDRYLLDSAEMCPPCWYGFRFFNVYGPDELHKGSMMSAITRIYLKALADGEIKLYKSIDPQIRDGYQKRDFIHVSKVVKTMYHFYLNRKKIPLGIYNVGTGKARTFIEIAGHINDSLKKKLKIRFIDIPESIRNCYQSVTQADTAKLSAIMDLSDFDDFDLSVPKHYDYLEKTVTLTR